jgi:hypothetical protein
MTYPDSDILGGCEEPIDDNTNERRIQPKLDWKFCKLGICHALRHDHSPYSYTCDLG